MLFILRLPFLILGVCLEGVVLLVSALAEL